MKYLWGDFVSDDLLLLSQRFKNFPQFYKFRELA